jgi:uncharacterized protein YeaO (DUF488 family)
MPAVDGVPGLWTTYAAALQHDQAEVHGEADLVGIVRRPLPWFSGIVDENVAALGPPPELLETFRDRAQAREDVGLDDVTAHNEAWDEVDYEVRYKSHLESGEDARKALAALARRLEAGGEIALVCYEAPEKACHRHLLADTLADEVDA